MRAAAVSESINTSSSARECVESARSYFKGPDLDRRQGKYMAARSADLQKGGEAVQLLFPFLFIYLFYFIVSLWAKRGEKTSLQLRGL